MVYYKQDAVVQGYCLCLVTRGFEVRIHLKLATLGKLVTSQLFMRNATGISCASNRTKLSQCNDTVDVDDDDDDDDDDVDDDDDDDGGGGDGGGGSGDDDDDDDDDRDGCGGGVDGVVGCGGGGGDDDDDAVDDGNDDDDDDNDDDDDGFSVRGQDHWINGIQGE